MATENEASCESDPNFAVICSFLEKFGKTCGIIDIDFLDLQEMLENTQEVAADLVELHIKLLRKTRRSVNPQQWEKALIKLCHTFSSQDAWELERFGYKKARISTKLEILKKLLEMQFDLNSKFKTEVNRLTASELRLEPLGRDKSGHAYWYQCDEHCQIRVYKEDTDEETWVMVAKNREELIQLINVLSDNTAMDSLEPVLNEDSNSLEIEKPITDTGQVTTTSSSQEDGGPDSGTGDEETQDVKEQAGDSGTSDNAVSDNVDNKSNENSEKVSEDRKKSGDNGNGMNLAIKLTRLAEDSLNEVSAVKLSPEIDLSIKKTEPVGIKEKYFRNEVDKTSVNSAPPSANSVIIGKAVQSAGYMLDDQKEPAVIEEPEEVEPKLHKRPRLDRPTLLGPKKVVTESSEEEEEEVSGEIEEPALIVQGEGNGKDCEQGNPASADEIVEVGEAIEEEVMFFYGFGSGEDCQTGNEGDNKESTGVEQKKTVQGAAEQKTVSEDDVDCSKDLKNNCESIETISASKCDIKLGKVVDVKTDKSKASGASPVKRSRWDMGKPNSLDEDTVAENIEPPMRNNLSANLDNVSSEKASSDPEYASSASETLSASRNESKTVGCVDRISAEAENETSVCNESGKESEVPAVKSAPMFFFGPGCMQFKSPSKVLNTDDNKLQNNSDVTVNKSGKPQTSEERKPGTVLSETKAFEDSKTREEDDNEEIVSKEGEVSIEQMNKEQIKDIISDDDLVTPAVEIEKLSSKDHLETVDVNQPESKLENMCSVSEKHETEQTKEGASKIHESSLMETDETLHNPEDKCLANATDDSSGKESHAERISEKVDSEKDKIVDTSTEMQEGAFEDKMEVVEETCVQKFAYKCGKDDVVDEEMEIEDNSALDSEKTNIIESLIFSTTEETNKVEKLRTTKEEELSVVTQEAETFVETANIAEDVSGVGSELIQERKPLTEQTKSSRSSEDREILASVTEINKIDAFLQEGSETVKFSEYSGTLSAEVKDESSVAKITDEINVLTTEVQEQSAETPENKSEMEISPKLVQEIASIEPADQIAASAENSSPNISPSASEISENITCEASVKNQVQENVAVSVSSVELVSVRAEEISEDSRGAEEQIKPVEENLLQRNDDERLSSESKEDSRKVIDKPEKSEDEELDELPSSGDVPMNSVEKSIERNSSEEQLIADAASDCIKIDEPIEDTSENGKDVPNSEGVTAVPEIIVTKVTENEESMELEKQNIHVSQEEANTMNKITESVETTEGKQDSSGGSQEELAVPQKAVDEGDVKEALPVKEKTSSESEEICNTAKNVDSISHELKTDLPQPELLTNTLATEQVINVKEVTELVSDAVNVEEPAEETVSPVTEELKSESEVSAPEKIVDALIAEGKSSDLSEVIPSVSEASEVREETEKLESEQTPLLKDIDNKHDSYDNIKVQTPVETVPSAETEEPNEKLEKSASTVPEEPPLKSAEIEEAIELEPSPSENTESPVPVSSEPHQELNDSSSKDNTVPKLVLPEEQTNISTESPPSKHEAPKELDVQIPKKAVEFSKSICTNDEKEDTPNLALNKDIDVVPVNKSTSNIAPHLPEIEIHRVKSTKNASQVQIKSPVSKVSDTSSLSSKENKLENFSEITIEKSVPKVTTPEKVQIPSVDVTKPQESLPDSDNDSIGGGMDMGAMGNDMSDSDMELEESLSTTISTTTKSDVVSFLPVAVFPNIDSNLNLEKGDPKSHNKKDAGKELVSEVSAADKTEKHASEIKELDLEQPKIKLACIDISRLTGNYAKTSAEPSKEVSSLQMDLEDSQDILDVPETDPLACTEADILLKESVQPSMSITAFKLDSAVTIVPVMPDQQTGRRKRGRPRNDNKDPVTIQPVKKMRLRGRRSVDVDLRKSIENQRNEVLSSEEDSKAEKPEVGGVVVPTMGLGSIEPDELTLPVVLPPVARRGRGRPKKSDAPKLKTLQIKAAEDSSVLISSDAPSEENSEANQTLRQLPGRKWGRKKGRGRKPGFSPKKDNVATEVTVDNRAEKTKKKAEVKTEVQEKRRSKKKILGLEITEDVIAAVKEADGSNVRQSRRIAQIKIKEEAERRKIEEFTLMEMKEEQRKKKSKKHEEKDVTKSEKRKRKKKEESEPDEEEEEASSQEDYEAEIKKMSKKKKKHRNTGRLFDESNPWKSSSDSSSGDENVEEEEEIEPSDDDAPLVFKSDHEFSPESDLEEGADVQPMKRARTAKKETPDEEAEEEEEVDEYACQKCGKVDHPEWILLCDGCDSGWHCSCLRPALLVIPEGDWYCPPCQHKNLVDKLKNKLEDYDKALSKRDMEVRRKERLAYVGISLDNVLPSGKEPSGEHHRKHHHHESKEESERSDSESESASDSSSQDSDEPVYQLRERRQAHSYRFNDYDDLINSAIQDEMDVVKGAGNQGRGKDIATIVNAEKEEQEAKKKLLAAEVKKDDGDDEPEPLPSVVPRHASLHGSDDSDDEPLNVSKKKMLGRKKHRKLNSLDISSGDDGDSDEDFKGSSSDDEEEEFDEEGSDSSEMDTRRGRRGRDSGPVRRSTRARITRYDRDFINDNSDDEAPKKKKTRSIWDESESEESDKSWGRRKRKSSGRRTQTYSKPKKSKKKKKRRDDSDVEAYKNRKPKQPKIKYGGLDDDDDDEVLGRRTRGKKINYLEALGTDSEDEALKPSAKVVESEDEYVAPEEDEEEDDEAPEREDAAESKEQEKEESDNESAGEEPPPKSPAKEERVPPVIVKQLLTKPVIPTSPKQQGRGKVGLKRALRKSTEVQAVPAAPPKDEEAPLPVPPPVLQRPTPVAEQRVDVEDEFEDEEDEDDGGLEAINRNIEDLNEEEMNKMMEEEDYANKQLEMVAAQIAKEKKRKERDSKKQGDAEPKVPKKRGRKPRNEPQFPTLEPQQPHFDPTSENVLSHLPVSIVAASTRTVGPLGLNADLSEPPLSSAMPPLLEAMDMPKKRRGRGKGKKTLAAEAAAAAIATGGVIPPPPLDSANDSMSTDDSRPNSSLSHPPPDVVMQGGKLGVAAPPQPFAQSQPAPSVITRMLQSQPIASPQQQQQFVGGPPPGAQGPPGPPNPQHKFFPGSQGEPPRGAPFPPMGTAGAPGGPRGRIPSPYLQQQQQGMYSGIRGQVPPRMRSPAPQGGMPQLYHTTHHPMDPSPSGGGQIQNLGTPGGRDRNSPALVPPAAGSPLTPKGHAASPPPYARTMPMQQQPGGVRQHMGFTHMQHPSPPSRPPAGGNFSPYHPPPPPNYYSTYPSGHSMPPGGDEQSMAPGGGPAFLPGPYQEQFPGTGVPGPPPGAQSADNGAGKGYDEETGGEFGGLVSYFSSQREDDLDT